MSDGPLGFAPNEHREGGDIVKQDFIAGVGRGEEGTKKLAAFSISLLLLLLSCLFNGIKVGIFASRWFGEGGRELFLELTSNLTRTMGQNEKW